MLLDAVMTKDDVQVAGNSVLPQAHRFARWILAVVIEVDDVCAAGVPPPCDDGVVLAIVAGVLDERDRDARAPYERLADLARRVCAAVVDEHDLVAALDVEGLDLAYEIANGFGAVEKRNDEAERDVGHAVGITLPRPPRSTVNDGATCPCTAS